MNYYELIPKRDKQQYTNPAVSWQLSGSLHHWLMWVSIGNISHFERTYDCPMRISVLLKGVAITPNSKNISKPSFLDTTSNFQLPTSNFQLPNEMVPRGPQSYSKAVTG